MCVCVFCQSTSVLLEWSGLQVKQSKCAVLYERWSGGNWWNQSKSDRDAQFTINGKSIRVCPWFNLILTAIGIYLGNTDLILPATGMNKWIKSSLNNIIHYKAAESQRFLSAPGSGNRGQLLRKCNIYSPMSIYQERSFRTWTIKPSSQWEDGLAWALIQPTTLSFTGDAKGFGVPEHRVDVHLHKADQSTEHA